MVNFVFYHKVELNFVKNALEILIGFLSIPFVFINQTALIFPIFFYQYLKVKHMSNAFQKYVWKIIWEFLSKYAPPLIAILMLLGFGKEPEKKDKDDKNKKPDA